MLGHPSLGVRDLARSTAFYDTCLAALGYARVFTSPTSIGYGLPGTRGFHLAFIAPSHDAVDRFHAAALQLGGKDQGAPGLRPHDGPRYDAAFVLDPDGYKLEAKYPPPL